ncbi:MAG TPA: hypothetical protein VJJ52_00025 [Candidatus Nanoarchaeia archaeon]|nr:hypothetical protein [Candidatus Nanoarchaeia archaeon]
MINVDRREAFKAIGLLGLGTAASACDTVENIAKTTGAKSPRYIRAVRLKGKTYVEFEGKVFRIDYERPDSGRGINHLVDRLNPQFDDGDIQSVGKLAMNLEYKRDALEDLRDGQAVRWSYNPLVRTAVLSQTGRYAVPIQVEARNLEQVMSIYGSR